MNDNRVLCDRDTCHQPNALRNFLFKERVADGAGGMEDTHWVFDLCSKDANALLGDILSELRYRTFDTEFMLKVLAKRGIKTRVE
jgi:hypothetical protein